jgi:hypothetical protein
VYNEVTDGNRCWCSGRSPSSSIGRSLFVYPFACLSLALCPIVCLSASLSLCVHVSGCACVYISLCLCLSLCPSVCRSASSCLFVYLSMTLCLSFCVSVSACHPLCLFVGLSICLSLRPSVCWSLTQAFSAGQEAINGIKWEHWKLQAWRSREDVATYRLSAEY